MDLKYKRMINRMREKEKACPDKQSAEKWLLYILRCQDASFYTGITKDIEARVKKHNDGTASRYTRSRRPVELLYQERCGSRSQALVRECAVKALAKKQKEKLIQGGKRKPMKKKMAMAIAALFLVNSLSSFLFAGETHTPIAVEPSKEFDQVKKLAGVWEGKSIEKGKEGGKTRLEYKLTSGGSAVVEIISPGTPHEMHSIYYNQKGKLAMTHYCMLGNRPVLELTGTSESGFNLSLTPSSEINEAKEPHMHALKVTIPEPEHLVQEWTYYENGKPAGTTVFDLKRVQT